MIICDPESHIYTDTDTGRVIPNVTSIIEALGLSDFSKVNQDVMRRAQEFGKAVHTACHLYDIGDLDMGSLDPALKPYLNAWIKFKKETEFVILESEQIVYSKKHDYAGTPDKIAMVYNLKTLIDIKSSTTMQKITKLQTAGYLIAANETKKFNEKVKKRMGVQLKDNGDYDIKPYNDKIDIPTFLAALTMTNWKKINNVKEKA